LREVDADHSGDITLAEWRAAWRAHPELLDVMSVVIGYPERPRWTGRRVTSPSARVSRSPLL
jgi:hypothetical protein